MFQKHQSRDEEPTSRRIVSTPSAAAVLLIGLLIGYAAFYWFSLNPSTAVIVNGTAANRAVSYRYPWPGHTVFFAPARWVDRHVRPTYWQWRVEHELRIDLRSWAPPSDLP
jgi:hypothetical protein